MATKRQVRDMVLNAMASWDGYATASGEGEIEEIGAVRSEEILNTCVYTYGELGAQDILVVVGGEQFIVRVSKSRKGAA